MFLPANINERVPVVVYGHGQALNLEHYRASLEHLARKGVASIFPIYDKGFFDRDWDRMGQDYASITACALEQLSGKLDAQKVVYSGHSKGALVATVAAGIVGRENLSPAPKAMLIFAPAEAQAEWLRQMPKSMALTVVYSDRDSIIARRVVDEVYREAASERKQFILVKSFSGVTKTDLLADHFWVMTKKAIFGGGPVGSLHYHSAWKWLVASALDLNNETPFAQPYLYGEQATEKGLPGFEDELLRNW